VCRRIGAMLPEPGSGRQGANRRGRAWCRRRRSPRVSLGTVSRRLFRLGLFVLLVGAVQALLRVLRQQQTPEPAPHRPAARSAPQPTARAAADKAVTQKPPAAEKPPAKATPAAAPTDKATRADAPAAKAHTAKATNAKAAPAKKASGDKVPAKKASPKKAAAGKATRSASSKKAPAKKVGTKKAAPKKAALPAAEPRSDGDGGSTGAGRA
jgi:cytoskeletal protein RodZ